MIAKNIGYTYDEIARMTPYQQIVLCNEGRADDDVVRFNNAEEYQRWITASQRNSS